MGSPCRLGLGTMYVPLTEGLIYSKSVSGVRVHKWECVKHRTLYSTRRSVSTHCVPYPNSIKGSFNRLSYTHTHTHTHKSYPSIHPKHSSKHGMLHHIIHLIEPNHSSRHDIPSSHHLNQTCILLFI